MFIAENDIEVRYAETDQMGVVYHANYLIWMELGRTKLIEDLGFRYADMEAVGILSPVMDIQASYKSPIRYGDKVKVRTWIDMYDGLRVVYNYEIVNGKGEVAATGHSSHVCVKKDSFRPISIKRMFPDWHEAYEKIKSRMSWFN